MLKGRAVAGIALVIAIVFAALIFVRNRDNPAPDATIEPSVDARARTTEPARTSTTESRPATTVASTTTTLRTNRDDFTLTKVRTITGNISPKSVVATGTGLVFAQNMMYAHTMTVYDAAGNLVKTIPDGVDLAAYGIDGHPGVSRGAPVEAAVDPAGRSMFVTNYSMYGRNFGPEGSDTCSGPGGLSRSFVYRVDLAKLAIDGVAPVGMVPKYVAVTPDDRYVLVSNWCSYDLSVIDRATLKEVRRIPLGAYPRGIAVDGNRGVAYVAVMGTTDIARVDLGSFAVSWFRGVGTSPRHLVLSRDGSRLYATLNGENRVVAVDTATGRVVASAATGTRPRSMAMSPDGKALYVVNYDSNTVAVVRTSDFRIVDTIPVGEHPIGVTYEPTAHRVWVACYSGEIIVYDA